MPSLPPGARKWTKSQAQVSWAVTSPQWRVISGWNARTAPSGHKKGRVCFLGRVLGCVCTHAHTLTHTHTHSCWWRDGVDFQCECGADHREGMPQQDAPALGGTYGGGSSHPSHSHLACGVQQQEIVSETGEGRGGSAQHGKPRVPPGKLVLELCAVHTPICFVIAWLFLEATGVSRKPESVDCVSSVWGV